jgi:hypothetical protein
VNLYLWWRVGSLDCALIGPIADSAASLCICFSNSASDCRGRIANQINSAMAMAEAYNVNSELALVVGMSYMNNDSSDQWT